MEHQKNYPKFSSELKNKEFKRKLKPFRIKGREDPRDVTFSFTSDMINTNQALIGSVNPNEREQVMTEMSREGSKKVPSVSHSRPVTGRGMNALNTGSTNRKQFDFANRFGDQAFNDDNIFHEQSMKQDMRFSGGGSSYNGGFMKSITNDVFNPSLGLRTPREILIDSHREDHEKGVLTVENQEKKAKLYSNGVQSERQKEQKRKRFFEEVDPIMEHSESKFSRTIMGENSEMIVKELSAKLSRGSNSQTSFSRNSKKPGGRKKNLGLNKKRINREEKGQCKGKLPGGVQSLMPIFNVPSKSKPVGSVKKRNSVQVKEKKAFQFKIHNEITERSIGNSANTSNLVPSIHRHKLRPLGAEGNLINPMGEDLGPKSLQPLNALRAFEFPGRLGSRRVAQLKKDQGFARECEQKSRATKWRPVNEKRSTATEKTRKKGKKEDDKNILKLVGKRVLKRVRECIKGIDNLNVKIVSDKKSKKITFSINDLNDQDFGLQFDFVMGNETQEVNLNDFMISSGEPTPNPDAIEEERPSLVGSRKTRPGKSHKTQRKEHPRPMQCKEAKTGHEEGNQIWKQIDQYPHSWLGEAEREVGQFREYMGEKLNSKHWGAFSKFVLQLLYGIGIQTKDFARMGTSWQKMFKKLLVDRYFKDVKKNIHERLLKNPQIRELLLPAGKNDNLDIWGVSVEDFRVFFSEFENNFRARSGKNYPELDSFFHALRTNVSAHLDSSTQIASMVSLVGRQSQPVTSFDWNRQSPPKFEEHSNLKKRSSPLFQCHDFSVVQGSRRGAKKVKQTPLKLSPEKDVFVDDDKDEKEMISFKMTPSCGGNTSANFQAKNKFNFLNADILMESPREPTPKAKVQQKTQVSMAELRSQLGARVDGRLGSLVEVVTPNVIVKEKLMKNLKIFLSNMTNDLILHMVKINYLKKGKKIDEEGDGMVDLEVSDLVGQILTNITRDLTLGLHSEYLSTEFLQTFDYEIDFEIIQDFLAKREALNCLQRKKNNKYQRPKRNDEKVKKVYKKIMNQFLDDFKRQYFGVKDREDPNTYLISVGDPMSKPQMDYSYAFKPKEMELCFYVYYFGHLCSPPLKFCPERVPVEVWGKESEQQLARWHLTGLSEKEISTRAKMLISIGEEAPRKREKALNLSIAKSYKEFKERNSIKSKSTRSRRRESGKGRARNMAKINSFFDPTKKNFDSRVFLSFTQEYFNHLLNAEQFESKVIHYLKEKFVMDFMKDYPAEIAKKLERNRYHMLDLQKKKSKFLWNRYELLVALEYFKEKYCKGILSKQFQRSVKKDPMSLDIETYEDPMCLPNHQSRLLKYFSGNAFTEEQMSAPKFDLSFKPQIS